MSLTQSENFIKHLSLILEYDANLPNNANCRQNFKTGLTNLDLE